MGKSQQQDFPNAKIIPKNEAGESRCCDAANDSKL